MSDDAPKLRLKPRLQPDSPAAPADAPVNPSAQTPTPAPENPANEVPGASNTASTPPPIVAESASNANPLGAPLPPIGATTVRLKPKAPPPVAPIAPAPVVAATTAPPPALPPPPLAAPPPVPVAAPPASAPPAAASPERATTVPATNKKFGYAAIVIGVAGVVVLAAVGYVAYGRLKAKSAADEPARRVSRKNSEAPPTPASKSEPASPTANATPSTPVPDQSTPKPSEASPPAPPPPTPVASAAKPAAPAVVPPSAAFVAWVKNLKITGMRSGASPRILVERATFSVGEVMNADLGITFDGYDASRRVLRFKDQTGAIVERSH